MSLQNERMLTSSRQSWVGVEYSTELDKMNWIDMPTHIGEFLSETGTYIRPSTIANKMAEKNMPVSQLETVFK